MFSASAMILALGLATGAHTQIVRLGDGRADAKPTQRAAKKQGHVPAHELTAWAKKELADQLPPGLRILDVAAAHGVHLPRGATSARLAFDRELGPGVIAGHLLIETNETQRAVPLRIALAAGVQTKSTPVIRRGSEVMVVVRSGNVEVQSAGISQEAGAVGDKVSVLPQSSQRVVRGTVVDGKTV